MENETIDTPNNTTGISCSTLKPDRWLAQVCSVGQRRDDRNCEENPCLIKECKVVSYTCCTECCMQIQAIYKKNSISHLVPQHLLAQPRKERVEGEHTAGVEFS